ncbi:MAG: DUF1700 domain-containing protein [Eubacteriales bacterium]|nr:DUF1700 domain-containing protein [Eubacteriales bacterium]
MTKSEFLEILRQQLDGEMPSGEIYSNIHYYDQYIDKELLSGKTEEEVMNELGDPRLIAKTLIDADEGPLYNSTYQDVPYRVYTSEQLSYSLTDYTQTDYTQTGYTQEDPFADSPVKKTHKLDLTTWYGKAIVILAAAAIIFLLVTVLSMLIPVAVVLVLVGLVISMFKKKK